MSSKKPTGKALTKKLDTIFSRYIRLRDCYLTAGSPEYGHCITCNKLTTYKAANAGHFMSRRFFSVRWDEKNVHLQCVYCNKHMAGEQLKYSKVISSRYGEEVLQELCLKAQQRGGITSSEKIEMIEKYKALFKEMEGGNFDHLIPFS